MTLSERERDELRRLHEAATPGPWPAECRPVASGGIDMCRMKAVDSQGHFIKIGIHDHVVAHTHEDIADVTRERIDGDYVRYHYHNERDPKRELHPDAELISRVRDALPALLDAADERDRLREGLRDLYDKYMRSAEISAIATESEQYEQDMQVALDIKYLLEPCFPFNDTADQERGE